MCTAAIDHEVDIANKDADWRRKMLTLKMKMNDQRQLGRLEGRLETKREDALKMLRKNFNPDVISEITDLSVKEILELKDKISTT
ncbi:MAG: hypothetical protein Q4C55_06550 [Eubacterium sp.]|nr:hypothetical protein [Eubacterium sp.]